MKKLLMVIIIIFAAGLLSLNGWKFISNNLMDHSLKSEEVNIHKVLSSRDIKTIDSVCSSNGVYLFNSSNGVKYLIFSGSFLDISSYAPIYSNIKIEAKDSSLIINYDENYKKYTGTSYPSLRIVYRIKNSKDISIIRLYKNGEETHFNSVSGL